LDVLAGVLVTALTCCAALVRRGEAGFLRMRREPWQTAGLPYWKGIYSASYPSGKMKSTATPRPLLDCGAVGGSNSSATQISVNSSTSALATILRFTGVALDSAEAAQALLEGTAVALQTQWITNSFRPLVTSIRVLGITADEGADPVDEASRRRLLGSIDLLVDARLGIAPGKALDAAEFCVKALPRVLQDLQAQGMHLMAMCKQLECRQDFIISSLLSASLQDTLRRVLPLTLLRTLETRLPHPRCRRHHPQTRLPRLHLHPLHSRLQSLQESLPHHPT
jgi:hypothetical protein